MYNLYTYIYIYYTLRLNLWELLLFFKNTFWILIEKDKWFKTNGREPGIQYVHIVLNFDGSLWRVGTHHLFRSVRRRVSEWESQAWWWGVESKKMGRHDLWIRKSLYVVSDIESSCAVLSLRYIYIYMHIAAMIDISISVVVVFPPCVCYIYIMLYEVHDFIDTQHTALFAAHHLGVCLLIEAKYPRRQ